jgi:small ligand-binding sensory domain FIST
MPFAAACSTVSDSLRALDEVCTQALNQLQTTPDLAVLFVSPHHSAAADQLAVAAQPRLAARCLLGCGGVTIVANDQEIEDGPALSLWLGRWTQPDVRFSPFYLTLEETPDGYSLLGWPDDLADVNPAQAFLLLLADPYTFPVDAFLTVINKDFAGLRVVGGMASGGQGPGQTPLFLGDRHLHGGAVGVLVHGPIQVRSVVSQGCRPIGRHMVITRGQDNVIVELSGKSPAVQLHELWQELSPRDQELLRRGLHIGRVINEYQGEFHRGDFLIRNVQALYRDTGALEITDRIRVGQTVQFQVRDAETADEDLHELLQLDLAAHERKPGGALLFSCNGRGTNLFPEPHHDARVIRGEAGPIPLAGFFAQGELGPVGGQNFIHGFTASVVLFEE